MNTEMKISVIDAAIAYLSFVFVTAGCARANSPGEYRESKGQITRFVVDIQDPTLQITYFARLKDGSVIRPKLYYFRTELSPLGAEDVEKMGQISRTIGRNTDSIYRIVFLPAPHEVSTYVLLVRTAFPVKNAQENDSAKAKYQWADWQLLEIDAKDVSPERPIAIPAYEDLSRRELSDKQRSLLKDLGKQFEAISAEAKERARTPAPPQIITPPSTSRL